MPTRTSSVIALDPGKTTGWAEWDGETFLSQELPCWSAVGLLDERLIRGGVEAVVCESYHVTRETLKKTRQYWSLESIGAVRYLCMRRRVPFYLQTPGDAKSFVTNDKLRALDWRWPSAGGHQDDAARHLALWLVRRGRLAVGSLRGGGSRSDR